MRDSDFTSGTGMSAQHAVYPGTSFKVAPTDGTEKFNAIRIPLIPQACWRLNDPAFAFDSSFVLPAFQVEIARLAALLQANPGCPAALFGHADPAGPPDPAASDALNKTLSDRRAIAIYALLTRQPSIWEKLYSPAVDGDAWGTRAIQLMLQTLTHPVYDADGNRVPPDESYYGGDLDGKYGPETKGAVKQFQGDNGLAVDGDAGHDTRNVLFGKYMDALCTPAQDAPPASNPSPPASSNAPSGSPPAAQPAAAPFPMQPTDFLGGAGAGPGDLPTQSLQGCSRFNPVVLLSNDDMKGDKDARNAADAPNRRVLMFLFPKGTTVTPAAAWPCPAVNDPADGCKAAFWSDGDARRQNGDEEREYKTTRDTMACRFYDRFARRSPCEGYVVRVTFVASRPSSLCSYGRSFPKPSLLPTLREIVHHTNVDPALRVLVMGHTDAMGTDPQPDYDLSLERATALKAFLTKDVDFFRQKFDGGDAQTSWGWEEVQWMLSALKDGNGNPLYGGQMDGHRGGLTMLATQLLKAQMTAPRPLHRQVDDTTLKSLIQAYVNLVGPRAPSKGQVDVLGGGSWHPPRSFGKDLGAIAGPEYESNDMPFLRRFEIFLSRGAAVPSTRACPPAKHDDCPAYAAWCDRTREVIDCRPEYDALATLVDVDGIPVGGIPLSVTDVADGQVVGTFATSDTGVAIISLPSPQGFYILTAPYDDCPAVALDLRLPDQQGGAVLRVGHSTAALPPSSDDYVHGTSQ